MEIRGGGQIVQQTHRWIVKIWEEGHVPQAWRNANIVTIYKKGDRTECGNYRSISLLSTAGMIFARTLLNRLSSYITTEVVPETQGAFRSNQRTVDMSYCLRQLQKKCIEQDRPLYIVFVDFTKEFDTVGKTGLWQLLRKYGCPEKFTTGMVVNVRNGGEVLDTFAITHGVKQGCRVYIQSHQHADLFTVSHFTANTKTTNILVRELIFADNSALIVHSA